MVGGEALACGFKLDPQFLRVVNLAIVDQRIASVRRMHRLMAARKIDDREPTHRQRETGGFVAIKSITVRTAMDDRRVHCLYPRRILMAVDSRDAAHLVERFHGTNHIAVLSKTRVRSFRGAALLRGEPGIHNHWWD